MYLARMNIKRNIPITGPATVANALDDLFGFEAARKRQRNRDLTSGNVKPYFKPWRVFINHIDSYHGKILVDMLSDRKYIDPLSARADASSNEENVEFEDEDDEYREEEERGKRKRPDKSAEVSRKYEVIGTVLDREHSCPDNVTVITRDSNDKGLFLSELMTCGVIIYDITQATDQVEEACWVLKEIVRRLESLGEKSPRAFEQEEPTRHFILISIIMTWALTDTLDPTNPDLPFTEVDYRKRKPHPNYEQHIQCEKEVIDVEENVKLKKKLKALVICCGITYGEEEDILHYFFKIAWQNAHFLPIFGEGRNKIPLLYVRDLAATVFSALQNWPTLRYIVAVEQKLISQNTIVKKISQSFTTGMIRSITMEEALLLPEVSQQIYDRMTVDLNINPIYIVDQIRWHLVMPFLDVTEKIVEEYKATRNLRPVKIIVLGPPASGKTRVARYLADYYGIHYVYVKTLISNTIQKLIDDIEAAAGRRDDLKDTAEDGDEDKWNQEDMEEKNEEEVISSVAELQEQLDEIRTNMIANNGRLDDVVLNKLFLNRLKSKDCLNQGYVMDGYPKTIDQARRLFFISEEDLETNKKEFEDIGIKFDNVKTTILPELVVVLDASDEFLKERIINRPEREIQGTHYTEAHILRRMREYRKRNTDECTPLQLFNEMEIHPLVISVEVDTCPDMFPTIYQCLEKVGKPRNYEPTAEEMEATRKRAEAEIQAAKTAEKLQKEREILECEKQREQEMMELKSLSEKLKEEEEERLCTLAQPLRHYLTTYIFPTLTQALIEVAKLRPEDPIDFLAEYLFKKNPEGKMFKPDYMETMNMLLDATDREKNDILPREGFEADVAQFLKKQNKLFSEDEAEKKEARNVNREIETTSILKEICKFKGIGDFEKELSLEKA